MIDGTKTRTSSYYWNENNHWVYLSKDYTDKVKNYSLKQIEEILSSTSSWDAWKNNLKNRYNNDTENNLDAVFNRW